MEIVGSTSKLDNVLFIKIASSHKKILIEKHISILACWERTITHWEIMFMRHIELGNKVPLPQGKDQLYAQWFAKQREGSFLIIVGSTIYVLDV